MASAVGMDMNFHSSRGPSDKNDKKYMARKANPALLKPMTLSADLEAVVGKGPMPRSQVVKKLWEYIKGDEYDGKNTLRTGPSLQDKTNKRNINADDKLLKVFGGKKMVNMFEMTKLVSAHLS